MLIVPSRCWAVEKQRADTDTHRAARAEWEQHDHEARAAHDREAQRLETLVETERTAGAHSAHKLTMQLHEAHLRREREIHAVQVVLADELSAVEALWRADVRRLTHSAQSAAESHAIELAKARAERANATIRVCLESARHPRIHRRSARVVVWPRRSRRAGGGRCSS